MTPNELWTNHKALYKNFYSIRSIARRYPYLQERAKMQWLIMNMFFRKGEVSGIDVAEPVIIDNTTLSCTPQVPIMPSHPQWRETIRSGNGFSPQP